MKVRVRSGENNGVTKWFVDYRPPGASRKRIIFATKRLADVHAATLRAQADAAGASWVGLSAVERSELLTVWAEVRASGFSLRDVWNGFRQSLSTPDRTPTTLSDALSLFLREQTAALLSKKSLAALRSNVGRFVAGREAALVASVSRSDVAEWVGRPEWSPRTCNSYLTSLTTFFRWCRRAGFVSGVASEGVQKIPARRMPDIDDPPSVLTLAQVRSLLRAVLTHDPGLIPFVCFGLFAGLRPQREAGRIQPEDVSDRGILVRGLNAKDRKRRIVDAHPTLLEWLAIGGEMPPRNLRRRFEVVREAAGLISRSAVPGSDRLRILATGWDQDVLRHTFASNCLPLFGVEKTVAQLGHGNYEMLFAHYRAIVTTEDARVFWGLTPGVIVPQLFQTP